MSSYPNSQSPSKHSRSNSFSQPPPPPKKTPQKEQVDKQDPENPEESINNRQDKIKQQQQLQLQQQQMQMQMQMQIEDEVAIKQEMSTDSDLQEESGDTNIKKYNDNISNCNNGTQQKQEQENDQIDEEDDLEIEIQQQQEQQQQEQNNQSSQQILQNTQNLQKRLAKQQANFVAFAEQLPIHLRNEPLDLQNVYKDIKFKHAFFPDYQEVLLLYQKDVQKMIASKQEKKNWNQDDIMILIWIIIKYTRQYNKNYKKLDRADWQFIAKLIPGKDQSSIKFKFLSLIKSNIINDPWQEEENLLLKSLVEKYGKQKWQVISKELYEQSKFDIYRTSKQCREHFNNHLDPNISKQTWTKEEDKQLLQLILEFGKKWALIARKLEGRTENAVKNRYHALERSIEKNQQSQKSVKELPEQKLGSNTSNNSQQQQTQQQQQQNNSSNNNKSSEQYNETIMQLISKIQEQHKTVKSDIVSLQNIDQNNKDEDYINRTPDNNGQNNSNNGFQNFQKNKQQHSSDILIPKFGQHQHENTPSINTPLNPATMQQQPIIVPQFIPIQVMDQNSHFLHPQQSQQQQQSDSPSNSNIPSTTTTTNLQENKEITVTQKSIQSLTPEIQQSDKNYLKQAIFNEKTKELYIIPLPQTNPNQSQQQQQGMFNFQPYMPQYIYLNQQQFPNMYSQSQSFQNIPQMSQGNVMFQPYQQQVFMQQQNPQQSQQQFSAFPQQSQSQIQQTITPQQSEQQQQQQPKSKQKEHKIIQQAEVKKEPIVPEQQSQ